MKKGENWIFGQYNAGTTSKNKKGRFGSNEYCINKEGIEKIFSIPNIKDMGLRITYEIQEVH